MVPTLSGLCSKEGFGRVLYSSFIQFRKTLIEMKRNILLGRCDSDIGSFQLKIWPNLENDDVQLA